MSGLVALLREHGEAIEADLRQHYHVRLNELFRPGGDLTWRELGVLVRQLPPDSRTRLALGQSDGLWTLGDHLTALAIDELRTANWQRANAGAKSVSKKPPPIDRPGVGKKAKRSAHDDPKRSAALDAARERARKRREDIAAGRIT